MAQLILQPDATAGLDTFMDSSTATTNYGTHVNFIAGESNAAVATIRQLVQFDLSSIPADATIISAVLTLTYERAGSYRADNNRSCKVYRMKQAWVEAQATWTVYSTGNSWGGGGASGAGDKEATDIGSLTFNTTDADESEVEITLTAAEVQEMITDGIFTNNGFQLKMDTEDADQFYFHSSDSATAGKRPKLTITYTTPGNMLLMF